MELCAYSTASSASIPGDPEQSFHQNVSSFRTILEDACADNFSGLCKYGIAVFHNSKIKEVLPNPAASAAARGLPSRAPNPG
jgi:hypothetical protein